MNREDQLFGMVFQRLDLSLAENGNYFTTTHREVEVDHSASIVITGRPALMYRILDAIQVLAPKYLHCEIPEQMRAGSERTDIRHGFAWKMAIRIDAALLARHEISISIWGVTMMPDTATLIDREIVKAAGRVPTLNVFSVFYPGMEQMLCQLQGRTINTSSSPIDIEALADRCVTEIQCIVNAIMIHVDTIIFNSDIVQAATSEGTTP